MSKWKWIAQDDCGTICKYIGKPRNGITMFSGIQKSIKNGKENPNWQDTLINLKTEDYEIVDGILKRSPRKTELDKLIARVKLIDKKAAKWINKNRHKCDDSDYLCEAMPRFENCKYGIAFWCDIASKLDDQQPKQTVRYRVSLHKNGDKYYTHNSNNEDEEESFSSYSTFVKWKTDWIEVEV